MNNHFHLIGGPRDSDIAESLPIDYTVVDTETFDRPDPRHADIVDEDTRFVAKWRGDEKVYLTVGHEHDAGELVRRADLPNDAIQSALQVNGEDIAGAVLGKYEVHTVER